MIFIIDQIWKLTKNPFATVSLFKIYRATHMD